jgi:template-activating factor I
MQVGVTIANDIFTEAIEYFLGTAAGAERDEDEDDEDDDEDDDDDDAEEIDLEKPRSKKRRV